MCKTKVLVIDDDECILGIFTRFVEKMGFVAVPVLVTAEVSLSHVISVIVAEECTRVVTDFNMGAKFNGLDVLDAALNLGLLPQHLLLCTTDMSGAIAEQVAALRCFFLAKPVSFIAMQSAMLAPFPVEQ